MHKAALLFLFILSTLHFYAQQNQRPPDRWLGQERQDVIGSDGHIINQTLQLLYTKLDVAFSDCGEDCGLDTYNRLYLEFTSKIPLQTRMIKRKEKRQAYKLELFDDRRSLLASYFLSNYEMDIEEHAEARLPYVYKINITRVPRIILKQVVSWNIVALE